MSPRVIVSDVAGVRVLTLNRPEARNALDGALISALYEALVAADAQPGVRAVVLTGADPAFCAGIDLKELSAEVVTTNRFVGRALISAKESTRITLARMWGIHVGEGN